MERYAEWSGRLRIAQRVLATAALLVALGAFGSTFLSFSAFGGTVGCGAPIAGSKVEHRAPATSFLYGREAGVCTSNGHSRLAVAGVIGVLALVLGVAGWASPLGLPWWATGEDPPLVVQRRLDGSYEDGSVEDEAPAHSGTGAASFPALAAPGRQALPSSTGGPPRRPLPAPGRPSSETPARPARPASDAPRLRPDLARAARPATRPAGARPAAAPPAADQPARALGPGPTSGAGGRPGEGAPRPAPARTRSPAPRAAEGGIPASRGAAAKPAVPRPKPGAPQKAEAARPVEAAQKEAAPRKAASVRKTGGQEDAPERTNPPAEERSSRAPKPPVRK